MHGWKNRLAVWGSVVVTALLVLVLHLPTITHFVGFTLPPNLYPMRRFQGWNNLASPVEDMLAEREVGSVFLLAENQHIASELAFYMDALDITFVQPYNQRHTQFDFWPGPNTQIGKDAIYVAQSDEDLPKQLRDAFESIEPPSLVRILQGGKLLRRFSIYECTNFRGFP